MTGPDDFDALFEYNRDCMLADHMGDNRPPAPWEYEDVYGDTDDEDEAGRKPHEATHCRLHEAI